MLINEFTAWLEDQGVGTVGTNLFIGEFPKEIENAIKLLSVPSGEPDKYTGVEYQTIDVWCRYRNTADGYTKLETVFTLLHRMGPLYLPNYQIYNCKALGKIDDFDRDLENRKLLKATFELTYRNLDLVS